ncbi:MAG: tripartite tricarboxylate transporter substrate binding protein [Burkholderiaceae bacterium]|jgi:tripartite-type tricarboxylate transporter receptor subunit TctC|nr:tripartite tricarboxylate transporter substrate binding protein [Burkholderiaceae bacterium]
MTTHDPVPSNSTDHARRRLLLAASSGALMAYSLPRTASAQSDWPNKPIRLFAAQAPGSSNDTTARALATYLSIQLKTPVAVENKPGGIGMIAADAVARSNPDGYTLLITLHSQLAQAPVLLSNPAIDTSKDLIPVGAYSTGLSPAAVKKDLPVKNLKELIALSKTRPITVGNYGIGSGWQLMIAQLAEDTGGEFTLVNYKGTGPMMVDLMAGNIDIGAGSLAGLTPGIQKGAIRPLFMLNGDSKNPVLPGIPNWVEEGFTGPAYQDLREYNMVLAPAGTPAKIIDTLGDLINRSATESEEVKSVLALLGIPDHKPLTGTALKEMIARVWPIYQNMTRKLNIKVN